MKIIINSLTLATVLVCGGVHTAHGQVTRADTARVILNVANELQRDGQMEQAERLYALVVQRFGETQAALVASEALRDVRTVQESRSGRTELIAWSTVYGAALGIMIPAALGADEAEPYGLGLLLGGPAGFGMSKAWTGQTPVSAGQARAMTFGSWWGTWQGIGWQQALNIGDKTRTDCFDTGNGIECFEYESSSDQAPFTAMVLGGLTGMAVGTAIGRTRPISASSALITNFSAMWGSWFGTVVGVLTDNDDFNAFDRGEDHSTLIASLVGGNIGLLAGAFGAPSLNWTTGQAWSVHLAGIAGMVAGFGLDLLGSVDNAKAGLGIPGLTSALGLAIAAATINDRDPTAPGVAGSLQMSLLDVQDGDASIGIPTPIPTMIPVWRDGRRHFAPGAKVTLFNLSL